VEKEVCKKRHVEEKIIVGVQGLFQFYKKISCSEEGNDLFTIFCRIRSVP
jgi:hypothetical protein